MAAGSLSAPKARIALQLALNAAKESKVKGGPQQPSWQAYFAKQALF